MTLASESAGSRNLSSPRSTDMPFVAAWNLRCRRISFLIKESAEVGLPEVSLGTYVGGGVTYLLPRLVGLAKARPLIFLGQRIDGREAVAIGLATRAFADGTFADDVHDFAEALKHQAPLPMTLAKEHMNNESIRTYDMSLDSELEGILACMATRDWREGVEAFTEKRTPVFQRK